MSALTTLIGVAGVVTGVLLSYYGHTRWSVARIVSETPTTSARELSEEGLVELKGDIVPAEETFESPITGATETVLTGWEVEEWDERGKGARWKTLATGITSRPFYVDDGTGKVLVDPGDHVVSENALLARERYIDAAGQGVEIDGVTCEFRQFPVGKRVGAEDETPEPIERFVAGEAGISRQSGSITNLIDMGNAHGDRRYYEEPLRAGQEVYVLGEAQASEDATHPLGPDDVVVEPPEDELFIVSEVKESALISRAARGKYALVGGIALIAGSGYLLGPAL